MKTLKTLSLFLIITLFGCTEEITNIYTTTADGLGKTNVYIEGDITNEKAQAKLLAEIGTQTENIYVQYTSQLTDININFSNNIRDIIVKNNPNLKNITLQGNSNKINEFRIYDEHYLNNITIKGIVEANAIYLGSMADNYSLSEHIDIKCYDLVTINSNLDVIIGHYNHPVFNKANFYDLKYINKTINDFDFGDSFWRGNYSEFNMPKLETVEKIYHYIRIPEVTYPKLKQAKELIIDYGPNNQILNFPFLERCDRIINYGNSGIYYPGTVNLPNLNYCEIFELGYVLTSVQVNSFLHQFLSINPSIKRISLGGIPTGQGILDKQTLINNGNIVETN